jgi:hypothetical protein
MRCVAVLSAGVVLLTTVDAKAQFGVGMGFGGSNMGYHASTVAEGEGNAMSSVTRSRGQYQLDRSQARINNAQADAQVMQNRKQLAADYFETRSINKKARFGDYDERKKINTQNNLFRYGQEGRPTRLTSSELDPVTGQITWPISLEAPSFFQYTQPIDEAFVKRAETRARFSYKIYQSVKKDCSGLEDQLQSQVRSMDPQDWTQAKGFVKRLKREVRDAAS